MIYHKQGERKKNFAATSSYCAFLGSTQSLVDTKKQQRPAIKQGTPCDGVWRDQPCVSMNGYISTRRHKTELTYKSRQP